MEHLHPDDALDQLKNIWRALKPGGVYICITPNRISGPHDISRSFDDIACGFHLKEYTFSDLQETFTQAGFSPLRVITKIPGLPLLRITPYLLLEKFLSALPGKLRKAIAREWVIERLLYIRLLARKQA